VCKLDALLIAKQVVEQSSNTALISIQFYNQERTRFRKVAVTADDIARFNSGAISQADLLSALQVVDSEPTPKVTKTDTTREKAPKGSAAAGQAASPGPDQSKYILYRSGEFSFYYPKNWTVTQTGKDDGHAQITQLLTKMYNTVLFSSPIVPMLYLHREETS